MKKSATMFMAFCLLLGLSACSDSSNNSQNPKPTETTQSPKLKPALITDYMLLPSGLNYTNFSAMIKNPNKSVALFDITVRALGIGSNDVVLTEQSFSIGSLLPNETWILENPFDVEGVLEAEFKISEPVTSDEPTSPRFTDSSFSGKETRYSSATRYDIFQQWANSNVALAIPDDAPYSSAIVCAAYFAKNESFLGAECEAKEIFAGRKNGFEILGQVEKYPAKVKFFARYGG